MSFETSFCGITRIHMGSLNHQTEGQSLAASLSWIEMKLDKWLLRPRFSMSKMVSWALVTQCITMGKRAIGLPIGGLDNHMSQHYSPHGEAHPLFKAEARPRVKAKNSRKTMLFGSPCGTTGSNHQLPMRQHVKYELVVYCLEP